jgi:predicted CxxxxCH...CXXCH cytochrome family protein
MGAHIRNRVAAVALVAALAACGGSSPPKSSAGVRPGSPGSSFLVTVQRPQWGVVASIDGRIDCGPASTRCGPESYAWDDQVTLVASPAAGYMLGTWVGDCTGRPTDAAGRYVCVLDTSRYGADKFVGAVFGADGRTLHPNFSDHTVHGPAFLAFVARAPDHYDCTACHAASYDGMGIAPSCNRCHAENGYPDWRNTCTFCHDAPPAAPPLGLHPAVSSALTGCAGCHPGTVDGNGALVPGGLHMDGQVEATGGGHAAGYSDPALHARDFFQFVSGGGGLTCTACHGATYGNAIANGQSCNSCHAAAGWRTVGAPNWQTNCSFCHGARDGYTQPGYAVADHPGWAAPPDAISQRLGGGPAADRTGAHQLHLLGSAIAGPFPCATCHDPVPTAATALTHIHARDSRSPVVVTAPGRSADAAAYDPVSQTCATSCHGTTRSPAWPTAGLQCDGCHGVPPATATHSGLSGADLTLCSVCHPDTITGAGAIDVAGGKHVNGQVEAAGHGAGFSSPAVHGPRALDHLAGAPGALDCRACHGATFGTPMGASAVSCNSCHASAGWATAGVSSWQTSCSFCHGLRDSRTQAGYDVAVIPTVAAPPDAVSQRLTGTPAPSRTGAHQVHLTGKVGAAGSYPPFPCATCHPVPSSLAHVSADRRATVTFDPRAVFTTLSDAELALIPPTVATYDPSTGTCSANYCHGGTMVGRRAGAPYPPQWSAPTPIGAATVDFDCMTCHGYPPETGQHLLHWNYGIQCQTCHHGVKHVSGKSDVSFAPGTSAAWWFPPIKTCTAACHMDVGYEPTDELGWR